MQAHASWIVRYSNWGYCNKKKGERQGEFKEWGKKLDVKLETGVEKLKRSTNYHFIMDTFFARNSENPFFHIFQSELIWILDSVSVLKIIQLCCCHISWRLLILDSAACAEYSSREKLTLIEFLPEPCYTSHVKQTNYNYNFCTLTWNRFSKIVWWNLQYAITYISVNKTESCISCFF